MFDDLLESGSNRHHRLASAGATVEGDHRDIGVEQQLEGEALLFVAGPQTPRLWHVRVEQRQSPVVQAGEGRL